MWKWLGIIIATLRSALQTREELALENLALRQQVAVLKNRCQRPRLTDADRRFWIVLSRVTDNWRQLLHIVQPDTVIRWYRQGFRYYWRWRSRGSGPPKIDRQLRDLIRQMSQANPLWSARRIHGELLKLGFDVCQFTVSRYLPRARHRRPPSQSWRVFLRNRAEDIISVDFLTVPTATFRVLFVLVVLSHERRRIVHSRVTAHPTAVWAARQLLEACGLDHEPRYRLRDRHGIYGVEFQRMVAVLGLTDCPVSPRSPWQNGYVERVIGSIRREYLDHIVVLSERQLSRVLSEYITYYNRTRTHLALVKDAPERRRTLRPEDGRVLAMPRVGGLHHEYKRLAVHLTRYHGVFAPHSALRAAITPAGRGRSTGAVERSPAERHRAMNWAQRLKRVFRIDIETCERCGGKLRIIASIEDPAIVGRILAQLKPAAQARGSPADPLVAHGPRGPPGQGGLDLV